MAAFRQSATFSPAGRREGPARTLALRPGLVLGSGPGLEGLSDRCSFTPAGVGTRHPMSEDDFRGAAVRGCRGTPGRASRAELRRPGWNDDGGDRGKRLAGSRSPFLLGARGLAPRLVSVAADVDGIPALAGRAQFVFPCQPGASDPASGRTSSGGKTNRYGRSGGRGIPESRPHRAGPCSLGASRFRDSAPGEPPGQRRRHQLRSDRRDRLPQEAEEPSRDPAAPTEPREFRWSPRLPEPTGGRGGDPRLRFAAPSPGQSRSTVVP